MAKRNVLIIGAAGRDFHNFNAYYRCKPDYNVVAFTAAQIPNIQGRNYPAELAGELYPNGIPIERESDLVAIIKEKGVHECVFSYSDVPYSHVMRIGAMVNAAGASFKLLGPNDTMLTPTKPLVAVVATRTGCGKSQTSRRVIELLMGRGLRVVAIRHPMPYGNLIAQGVQRFASLADIQMHGCTIEEMEEYEPHVVRGNVIYAGVDYQAILRAAENDPAGCDVIVWDGGNNDFPFYRPSLTITVTDPLRPGNEIGYYPGEVNLRMADIVIINKIDSALPDGVQALRDNIRMVNPTATVVDAASPVTVDNPELIRNKRCLVVEDGPTLTHGEMSIGAGTVAARMFGASHVVDPRPYLVGALRDTFMAYPNIGSLLPAMGYGDQQLKDLAETINSTDCDTVIIGTPIDLSRIISISKPTSRVHYELAEIGKPDLEGAMAQFLRNIVR